MGVLTCGNWADCCAGSVVTVLVRATLAQCYTWTGYMLYGMDLVWHDSPGSNVACFSQVVCCACKPSHRLLAGQQALPRFVEMLGETLNPVSNPLRAGVLPGAVPAGGAGRQAGDRGPPGEPRQCQQHGRPRRPGAPGDDQPPGQVPSCPVLTWEVLLINSKYQVICMPRFETIWSPACAQPLPVSASPQDRLLACVQGDSFAQAQRGEAGDEDCGGAAHH